MTTGAGKEDTGAYDDRDRAQGIIDDDYGDQNEHTRCTDGDGIETRGLEKARPGEEKRDTQKTPRPPLMDRSVESHPHTPVTPTTPGLPRGWIRFSPSRRQ